jgi:MoaA/NifB/PqqE/SkfB family radical SAM enzyme
MYRVNSDFDSISKGARSLRAVSACTMHWSSIFFRFNEDRVEDIRDVAKTLGFDSFGMVKSTKFDGRYLIDGQDLLKPAKQMHVSGFTVYDKGTVERLGQRSIPIHLVKQKDVHSWAKCLNWRKEMFINVEGLVFPCPWFNSGYQENDFVEKHKDRISIKTRSLMDILNDPIWQELITRFEVMPLEVCKIKCKNA